MSTLRGDQDACGDYHEYTGGCSVHWRDTMSTQGAYFSTPGGAQYTRGIP